MTDARVGTEALQVLIDSHPPGRVTTEAVQVLVEAHPPARVTTEAVQVLIGPGIVGGWGVGMVRMA